MKEHAKVVSGIVAGLIIGGAGSAVVIASIPDSSGVIHACYSNGPLGRVRIIDSATQTCNGNETAITWNQTGPQGPAGPAGPQGPQGPTGGSGSGDLLSNLVGADLTSANLPYRDLTNLDFQGSNFLNAVLSGSHFAGSNLSNTNLRGARLNNLDAPGVNFAGAVLDIGTTAVNANFMGANFSGGSVISSNQNNYTNANFQNANFTNALIFSQNPTNPSVFPYVSVDFRGVNLTNTVINAHFQSANFSGVDFHVGNFVQDNGSNFAAFKDSNIAGANFTGMLLEGVKFFSSNMAGSNFTNAQFAGVSLLGSDLSAATLTGASWSNTICPDGTNSDTQGNTCIGHLVP